MIVKSSHNGLCGTRRQVRPSGHRSVQQSDETWTEQQRSDVDSTVTVQSEKRTVVAAPQMHACQPRTVFNCRDVTSISVTRSRGVSSLRFGLCLRLRRLVNVSWFAGCWWLRAVSRREMTVEDTVTYKQWYKMIQPPVSLKGFLVPNPPSILNCDF